MAYFKRLTLLSYFVLLSVCSSGHTAGLEPIQTWCVTNSTQLQAALTAAETNNSGDLIKIATGYYATPPGGFVFNGAVEGADGFSLTLSGGWSEFFGNPCGQQLTQNPFSTILDGGGESRVLLIRVRATSNATVRLLALINGYVNDPQRGGGLQLSYVSSEPFSGKLLVERNAFIGNEALVGGGLSTGVVSTESNARIGVVNNVFVANHARSRAGVADIVLMGGNSGALGSGILVTNNTVINNTASDNPSDEGGMRIHGTTPNKYIVNNIFWGNQNIDLVVASPTQHYALFNNNIGVRTGIEPTDQAGNLSIEPDFEPCSLCFAWVPLASSPLVDGGIHPPFISPFWFLTELDLRGNPRIHNGTVDIGAYESDERMFSDRFEAN